MLLAELLCHRYSYRETVPVTDALQGRFHPLTTREEQTEKYAHKLLFAAPVTSTWKKAWEWGI